MREGRRLLVVPSGPAPRVLASHPGSLTVSDGHPQASPGRADASAAIPTMPVLNAAPVITAPVKPRVVGLVPAAMVMGIPADVEAASGVLGLHPEQ